MLKTGLGRSLDMTVKKKLCRIHCLFLKYVNIIVTYIYYYYYYYYYIITFMRGVYHYIPKIIHASMVNIVAVVLSIQFVLRVHVTLFHMLGMFYAFTLTLSEVCVQCPSWLYLNYYYHHHHHHHHHFILVLARTCC